MKDWPATKIETWSIDDLVPYERNARVHTDEQVGQVAQSIQQFGWTMPVLAAEDGTIIAGHCRVEAARKLGYEQVPVMVAVGWSDEQRRAYTLADNKLTENSSWDDELLAIEIGDLVQAEFNMNGVGFSTSELDTILSGWEPDMERVDNTEPDDDPLLGVVKVKYPQVMAEEVRKTVADAVEHLEGVSVE